MLSILNYILKNIIFCIDFTKNITAYSSPVIEHCSPIVVEQSIAWNADERRFFAGQFRFLPLWFKFHSELNDAISTLQSSYSRHRRFSMNRTVFSFVKQRATGTRALCSLKNHRSFCLVFTLPGREFTQNHVWPLFFFWLFLFLFSRVARLPARARLRRNVKFVTFHYCGLRYQNPDENSTSADHWTCESWKLLSPRDWVAIYFLFLSLSPLFLPPSLPPLFLSLFNERRESFP